MTFEEITKEEYATFATIHPLRSFLQTVEMADIALLRQARSYYIGIKKDGQLVCVCRLEAIKNKIGKYYFNAIRGPLLDYNNFEILNFFTQEVKKFVKKHKGYVLSIEPLIINKERDIDGNVVEGGINNCKIIENLKKLGYIHSGFNTQYDCSKQGRWVFCLNLDKSEEEIFSNMKQNHRNLIKKTERFGIEIKEINYEELKDFKKITEDTSERRNFNDKSLKYYQTMYKLFGERVKFLIAYINVNTYLDNLQKDLKIENDKYEKNYKIDANAGKTKELKITVDSLIKRIDEAKEMLKVGNTIPLSAAMFVLYEGEITYLFSGSYKKYMNFYAQYAIQWYMIKYGIKNNFRKYNFYGITGNFDKSDPEYGVYEFKKGFNGYVEEYIGNFDLPVTYFYKLKKFIK